MPRKLRPAFAPAGLAAVAAFFTLTFSSLAMAQDTSARNVALASAAGDLTAADAALSGPHPITEVALACLLGMGVDDCESMFVGARFNNFFDSPRSLTKSNAMGLISYCTEEFINRRFDNCPDGRLETVEYLGVNTAGADVYLAKFMHKDKTYVISQPMAGGKIPSFWRLGSSPNWVVFKRRLIELRPPVLAPRLIYSMGSSSSPLAFSPEAPTDAAIKPVVVASTPSGVGDPNAIVCRAPQPIAGSDQLGPQACGPNHEWWRLAISGKDLAADGKTLIDKPMVKNPTGEGDPDTVTCRTPKFSFGPLVKVCRTNRFWAEVRKNHLIVDAQGGGRGTAAVDRRRFWRRLWLGWIRRTSRISGF